MNLTLLKIKSLYFLSTRVRIIISSPNYSAKIGDLGWLFPRDMRLVISKGHEVLLLLPYLPRQETWIGDFTKLKVSDFFKGMSSHSSSSSSLLYFSGFLEPSC